MNARPKPSLEDGAVKKGIDKQFLVAHCLLGTSSPCLAYFPYFFTIFGSGASHNWPRTHAQGASLRALRTCGGSAARA